MAHPNRIAYYRDRCDPPLTQAALAGLLAVHPNTVQNWERHGVGRPDALLRLCRVFVERGALGAYADALAFWQSAARDGAPPPPELRLLFARGPAAHGGQALALPLDRPPDPEPALADALPYRPNPRFTGRDGDLRVLAALLRPPGAVAAVCGIGGLGKTQLAVEFAHRYGARFPGGVCWVDAADPAGIPAQVAAWGARLGGAHGPQLSFERRLAAAQAAWRAPTPRLLVFDDCAAPETLLEWLPPSGGCRALVTSRTRAWAAHQQVAVLDLAPLERRDSLALLRALGPGPAADAALGAIAAALGDLPLALHLAGKHLARTGGDPSGYAAQLAGGRPLRHSSLQAVGPSPTAYGRRLAEVIGHAYRQLGGLSEDRCGRAVLAAVRHLAPGAPVPAPFLRAALPAPADGDAPLAAALARLGEDLGLVDLLRDGQELRAHPVVHAFLRELPDEPGSRGAVVRAVLAQAEASVAAGAVLSGPLLLHMRHVADEARRRGDPAAAELCRALAWPLATAAEYPAARQYAEHAVALGERAHGPQHPAVAGALNVLALIEQITGAFPAAEAAYLRALAVWERTCGPDSDEVATVSNNLGFLALLRGRYDEAESRLRRALRLRRRHAGLRDGGTARIVHNLGYLALRRGEVRRADRYLRLALAIRRQVLPGPGLGVAFTLTLLADARRLAGDLGAAEALASEALALRRAVGGPFHDDVGASLAQLGQIARAAGDLGRAAALAEEALRMREALLGPEAFETLLDVALLAGIYGEQGRVTEARAMLDRAVAGLAAATGEGSWALAQAQAERARLG
jgi:tetratricopeptide (TPR) repeat protein